VAGQRRDQAGRSRPKFYFFGNITGNITRLRNENFISVNQADDGVETTNPEIIGSFGQFAESAIYFRQNFLVNIRRQCFGGLNFVLKNSDRFFWPKYCFGTMADR